MNQRVLELWRLGWWMIPVMAVMGSPWIPGLSSIWGTFLQGAKEAMQVVAPVLGVLVVIGSGSKSITPRDER